MSNITKLEVETIISVELFKSMLYRIEQKLNDIVTLKKTLKFNEFEFNNSLKSDFSQMVEVLQNFVDSYYFGYYEVDSYEYMTLSNIELSLKHNKTLLNNAIKLIKFIE